MTRKFIICTLAALCIHFDRLFAQAVTGQVMRLQPTTLPATCNNGDLRSDINNAFLLNICASNAWGPVSPGSGGAAIDLSNLSNVKVNTTIKPLVTNSVALGAATAAWSSVFATNFFGIFNGTASFAAAAGTASIATAFASVPSACAAGVWANAIGPNGNLTCAIVSTASTSGTAFFSTSSGTASTSGTAAFAAVAGTASAATAFTATPTACGAGVWANAIGPNGNLTCAIVSTASQAGTAAFANAFNGTVAIVQGGTGQITSTAAFAALAPAQSVANLGLPLLSGGNAVPASWTVLGIGGGGTNNTAIATSAGGVLFMDGSKAIASSTGSSTQFFKGGATPGFASLTGVTNRTITSGSGVYTPAATALWLRLRMVGGGGSGGTNAADGTAGTSSTFGNFTASNGGGAGAGGLAGAGGTASGCTINVGGGYGGGGTNNTFSMAASGGASFFGGGGAGGSQGGGQTAGQTGPAFGSGGGGGLVTGVSRAAGGASGYCEAIITAISATYSYSVGVGGGAPTAAGAGAPGIIFIEEHYQ